MPQHLRFRVVCGLTGSGKSRLIDALAAEGAQVLDLERLARHRGSLLGDLPGDPQPSQKMFESALFAALSAFDAARPVFVESESQRIGTLQVPDALLDGDARFAVHPPRSAAAAARRAARGRLRASRGDPDAIARAARAARRLHGKATIARWTEWARGGATAELTADLLDAHYDPVVRARDRAQFPAPSQRRGPARRRRDARDVPALAARMLLRSPARDDPLDITQEACDARLALPDRQRVRRSAARRQSARRVRGRAARSTTRRCRRSRCSSTCRRRRSCCRRRRATARVRIFTPTFEMPFAGHPTLGTAHVVRDAAAAPATRDARDARGHHSGRRRRRRLDADRERAAHRQPSASREALAHMLRPAGERHRPRTCEPLWVDTGSEQLIIPLASFDAVRRAQPSAAQLLRARRATAQRAMAYVFARERERVLARFFFPKHGAVSRTRAPARRARISAAGCSRRTRRCRVALVDRPGRGRRTPLPARPRVDADRSIRVSGRVIEIGRGTITL